MEGRRSRPGACNGGGPEEARDTTCSWMAASFWQIGHGGLWCWQQNLGTYFLDGDLVT